MAKNNRKIFQMTSDYNEVAHPMREVVRSTSNVALANLMSRCDTLADTDAMTAAIEGGDTIERQVRAIRSCTLFAVEIGAISPDQLQVLNTIRAYARIRAYGLMSEIDSADMQKAIRSGAYSGSTALSELLK
jgi:hypothetical protein